MRSAFRNTALAVALLGVCAALSGCWIGRARTDHPLDEHKIAGIQRGVTTKAEILERFGPPQEVDARELTAFGVPFDQILSGRTGKPPLERIVAARYVRDTYAKANLFGILTYILINYVDIDVKRDSLVIFFDGDDKVEDFAYARDTDQLRRFGFFSR